MDGSWDANPAAACLLLRHWCDIRFKLSIKSINFSKLLLSDSLILKVAAVNFVFVQVIQKCSLSFFWMRKVLGFSRNLLLHNFISEHSSISLPFFWLSPNLFKVMLLQCCVIILLNWTYYVRLHGGRVTFFSFSTTSCESRISDFLVCVLSCLKHGHNQESGFLLVRQMWLKVRVCYVHKSL